ncbi:hypothetical protein ACFLZ2_01490 [Candidatus Margulisiibacteriota bacterium]
MKKLICFSILFVFVLSSLAFAGAAKPVTEVIEIEEEIIEVAPPPPPPPEPSAEPLIIKKFSTWGLGLGGNPLFGYVEKDELALYPKTEYGFTWVLGFGVTWFDGQPGAKEIRQAAMDVESKYGTDYGKKTKSQMIREELGITSLTYTTLGSWGLILPVNAEVGYMWILSDNMRTRLGIGLPTLISFGINFDF